jgi:hypothetical protein
MAHKHLECGGLLDVDIKDICNRMSYAKEAEVSPNMFIRHTCSMVLNNFRL